MTGVRGGVERGSILGRRGVVAALMALRRVPGMTAKDLGAAAGLKKDATTRLRRTLEETGLVEARVTHRQGPVEVLALRLTPWGEAVADLLLQAEPIVEAAARRGPQSPG